MKASQYSIQKVDLEIEPDLSDVEMGRATLEFIVEDAPEYDEDLGALKFETELELELHRFNNELKELDTDQLEVGDISVEVMVTIEGDESEFQNYIETWNEDGYRKVNWDFRHHVESGFLTEVMSPLAHLVDDSFRGVLPGVTFTEQLSIEDVVEEEQIPEIEENVNVILQETAVDYLVGEFGDEFSPDDVTVEVDILSPKVTIAIGEYESSLDDETFDEISNLISESMREALSDQIDSPFSMDSPKIRVTDDEI